MEIKRHYGRNIFSLSNQEIIALVDFIYDDVNLDRLAHCLYDERSLLTNSINYRKVEILSSYYEFAYAIKVSFGLTGLDRLVTSGFMLVMEGGPGDEKFYQRDIYISSIKDFYRPYEGIVWQKGIADDFDIELDYSIFTVYHNKLNKFLHNTLNLWSDHLPDDKYSLNPQLQNLYKKGGILTFVVEEVREQETAEQE